MPSAAVAGLPTKSIAPATPWSCASASAAREEVLRIHLKRNKQDPAAFDLARLAAACDGFSGAEIEQAIIAGLYEVLAEKKPLSKELIEEQFRRTKPLSVVMGDKVAALREWASTRTVPAN